MAAPLRAEVPHVVADIAPVHALVAQVMKGVGAPNLLMQPGVSPHNYAMRPSEARMLQNADLVVWIGPELTPSLAETIPAVASGAAQLVLLDLDETQAWNFRTLSAFVERINEHDQKDDHGHNDHNDADTDASHSHDGEDPHAWLDPANGEAWLLKIAGVLSEIDPENATTYGENAARSVAELKDLQETIKIQMDPVKDQPFVVFHDAYQYFEKRFDLSASGALLDVDGAASSAARLVAIRNTLIAEDVICIFSEPQFATGIVSAVSDGIDVQVVQIDPMGARQNPGPDLYVDVLTSLAREFVNCLSAGD